jgi:hypothetical protein
MHKRTGIKDVVYLVITIVSFCGTLGVAAGLTTAIAVSVYDLLVTEACR